MSDVVEGGDGEMRLIDDDGIDGPFARAIEAAIAEDKREAALRRWCRLGDHLLHTEREQRDGVCAACAEVWEQIEAEEEVKL